MRSLQRTAPHPEPALARDIALVCLADGIVGLSFGATSVAGGLAWWVPIAMSVLVFAGGSQIAAAGIVLAGGSPLAAVAAGAVLNTRLFPYGLAVADAVQPGGNAVRPDGGARRWTRLPRLLGRTQLITDESTAFALRPGSPARQRTAFLASGAGLFVTWNVAVLLGVLAGSVITDTRALGLDATSSAVLLALALPALTSRPTQVAAGTGALIAVALTPVLPIGLPVLAALLGLGPRFRGRRGSRGGS